MTEVVESTRVTFPAGALEATSTVLAVLDLPAGAGVITAESPFHPVDHTWPDQPADTGTVIVRDDCVSVIDCVTGAQRLGSDTVSIGSDIGARRGDDDWHWFVVHVVDAPYSVARTWAGAQARLQVEPIRRARLSASHTACHLMAFALNDALAERWRKVPNSDSLGNPNFDAIAITSSRIGPESSIDVYRLGKSLRKKGFTNAATDTQPSLAESLDALATAVTTRLRDWIGTDAPVRVDAPDTGLAAPRKWECELPEGTAAVLCGGTHVDRLSQLGEVEVSVTLNEDNTEMTIVTSLLPQVCE